jgi:hypothetical protein
MTHEQIIEVVKAHKEGKKIQCNSIGNRPSNGGWIDTMHLDDSPAFNFCDLDYRVKPEPEYVWILKNSNGYNLSFYDCELNARIANRNNPSYTIHKFKRLEND